MRRNWLASAAVAAAAISVPATAITGFTLAGTAQAAALTGQQQTVQAAAVTWNQVAASLARTLVGDPYSYGGTSPAGF